ncbi:glycosyltransferase [Actinokineospora sp. NPDC004072]
MRVLFASLASAGHTYPLIPLATALRAVGHEVRFAAGEHVHAALSAAGLRPFRPADVFYEVYAEDLAPELDRWRPDLVVHGWGVPGAAEAAAKAGVPGVWHGFGRMFPPGIGLAAPDAAVPGLPHLDICPPSLQDKAFLTSAARIPLRPIPHTEPSTDDWSPPLIYVTLGTAFASPDLLRAAIAGVAPLGHRVVVAAGNANPADLGELPANVTVRPWLPQAAVLAHAALVVHHGGSGTMLAALAAGIPQLLLPQGADQPANADALQTAGAALRSTPEALPTHAKTLLTDPAYREAARSLATEIAAMPSPAEVAQDLATRF